MNKIMICVAATLIMAGCGFMKNSTGSNQNSAVSSQSMTTTTAQSGNTAVSAGQGAGNALLALYNQYKADGNKYSYNPALTRRRNDDGKEHAVKGNAQRTDSPQRQQIARNDAQRRTDGPSRCRQQNGTVGIIWVQAAGPCNGDAKKLVCHIITDEQPVPEGCARRKALGQCAAHEQIARIDDQHHQRDNEETGVGCDDGDAAVFAGGGIVEQAEKKALRRAESRRTAGDAETETHR